MRFVKNPTNGAAVAWFGAAAFMAALLVVIAPGLVFDDRLINGAGVWDKPAKFCLALGVHFATLGILVNLIPADRRRGLAIAFAVLTSIAAGVFEIVYIALQAARGRASHFNYETSFESRMYIAMGIGAVLLVLAAFIVGVKIARARGLRGTGVETGAALGLMTGAVMTLVLAGFMSSNGSHYFNARDASDAGGLFVFGWSTTHADLRVSHFFATHLMQAAPIAGWAGDCISTRAGRAAAILAALVFATISVSAFAGALAGYSPIGFLSGFFP